MATARVELVRTGQNLVCTLADLDKFVAERRASQLQEHVEEVQRAVSLSLSPSKRVAEVQRWLDMYTRPACPRKKFRVLEGPSGEGQTAFLRCTFLHGVHWN